MKSSAPAKEVSTNKCTSLAQSTIDAINYTAQSSINTIANFYSTGNYAPAAGRSADAKPEPTLDMAAVSLQKDSHQHPQHLQRRRRLRQPRLETIAPRMSVFATFCHSRSTKKRLRIHVR